MREGDPELDALREAIQSFAAARAPELVAEARAEALARVRSILAEAIAEQLLERSADLVGGSLATPERAAPVKPASGGRARRAAVPTRGETTTAPARSETTTAPGGSIDPRMRDQFGCYVYGVTAPDAGGAAEPGVIGVDGEHRTRFVQHGGLAAIVSDVPLDTFGEEPLLENLNDVDWLELTARAHERVLDEALSRSTVVPMRLCTIYRGEAQVREMLERERGALSEALDRLAAKTEWGVKMIAAPGALEQGAESERRGSGDDPTPELSPGTAYIDAKRRQARANEDLDLLAESWAAGVHDRLASAAAEALLNPLQSSEIAGYEGEMLLNGVYLVDDRETERFRELVEEIAGEWEDRGVSVELTGPWPPYNFVKNSIEAAR